ncbi:MAG TPA: Zn-dependent hydrolase [Bacteroidales bacterium]|nr:Zn-dependent hydrolase [Bacteroidales bacterium]HPR74082.1 Zn-dependent hydrolase [Bacteroidales bacterium]
MNKRINNVLVFMLAIILSGCGADDKKLTEEMKDNLDKFREVRLTTDLSWLSSQEKEIITILIDVAVIMDDIFWMEAYGDKEELFDRVENEYAREYIKIHYGPWDRLNGNAPFLPGFGEKPASARFYPSDMTVSEFEEWDDPEKNSLYTIIKRDDDGRLVAVPYSEYFSEQHSEAALLMMKAAELAEDEGLKKYLTMRAEALLSNDYQPSDFAWMEMKQSNIDFVVGPIENYEDQLFGYKAAHEAFVLVKDPEWSARLAKYNSMLTGLQAALPVDPAYKSEVPGTDADMNVYDAIYYAGDCNAGSKTIAINLPNDPEIHLAIGSRKLQLKNSMKAKFDNILIPIANMLIDESQRQHITFDAFFENTTFHEVAHGMGVKNTINNKGTVRDALKEQYSALEEAKADIMGLWLVTRLYEMGEITSGEVMDNYVTFFAGIFRSSRFGAASAHGKANMLSLKYFADNGAFVYQDNGYYKVRFEEMKKAVESLVGRILTVQGDGDYETAKEWIERDGVMTESLRRDLDKVNEEGIPVDIVFKQGKEVLGLQ